MKILKLALKKKKKKVKEFSCSHEWKIISKTYASPTKGGQLPDDVSVLQKAILGVTSYLWQCKICSDVKTQEMLGSDTNQLAEICEKVDTFGPQYIEEAGKNYVISRWVNPSEQIPVR